MKKGCLVALVLAIFLAAGAVLFGPQLVEAGMKFLYPQRYADLVEREAAQFELDPDLVYAIIKTESGFDSQAVSSAGAKG